MRVNFSVSVLKALLRESTLGTHHSVLAVCAGASEENVFREIGLTDVTISNLSDQDVGSYKFEYQNAMSLDLEDKSFDFVFVSDGLHHCDAPHLALTEMYRVARIGVVVLESKDSFFMRIANNLGLTESYECEAVEGHLGREGGVNNSAIPNFVYRWSEREFEKTLCSYDPTGQLTFRYFYSLNLPLKRIEKKMGLVAAKCFTHFGTFLEKLIPSQCNSIAMIAIRPGTSDMWPWLELNKSGEFEFVNVHCE
jgi:SAM-dependent methyltransferase